MFHCVVCIAVLCLMRCCAPLPCLGSAVEGYPPSGRQAERRGYSHNAPTTLTKIRQSQQGGVDAAIVVHRHVALEIQLLRHKEAPGTHEAEWGERHLNAYTIVFKTHEMTRNKKST